MTCFKTSPASLFSPLLLHLLLILPSTVIILSTASSSHEDNLTPANKLYSKLLGQQGTYNKLIRPVGNASDALVVKIRLRLTSIIDIDEKNQIMTTNVWLEQNWSDLRLTWEPEHYGCHKLQVPSTHIWLPDIVLYNSADGNFTIKTMTKATIHYDGRIEWIPPAIYKSLCLIDVEYFPFDEQQCTLKIGSWSYDGGSVDIQHMDLPPGALDTDYIKDGINLNDYTDSTEWDILQVPAQKYKKWYPCCSEPYPDIKFNITMRRKTLYHAVNLILPCVAICSVTLLVFFIPVYTGEKITMGITILNSLNIFLLLVAEINPPTSLAIPLIGKYLLFTMVLVTCSIIISVFVLNIHFRSPSTHVMSPWIRQLFLYVLPRLLFMQRPGDKLHLQMKREKAAARDSENPNIELRDIFHPPPHHGGGGVNGGHAPEDGFYNTSSGESSGATLSGSSGADLLYGEGVDSAPRRRRSVLPPTVMQAVIGVNFIAEHLKEQDEFNQIKQDWQFVAQVLDRLFMWMFAAVCLVGTFGIIIQAPTLYDGGKQLPFGRNVSAS